MPFLTPVEMDPVTQGGYSLTGGGPGFPAGAPYDYNGNLYMVLAPSGLWNGTTRKMHAFKSTDGGATWAELDAANAPPYVEFQSVLVSWTFNGLVCIHTTRDPSTPATNFLAASIFDCDLEIWAGAPIISAINGIFFLGPVLSRVANQDVLICITQYDLPAIPRYRAVTFDGAFGAPFAIDTNSPSPHQAPGGAWGIQGIVDVNNTVHLVFTSASAGPVVTLTYQQVAWNNILGPFQNWSSTNQAADKIANYGAVGQPAVHWNDNYVVIPFVRDSGGGLVTPSLLVGIGVANPAWSIWQDPNGYDPTIDPGYYGADSQAGDAQVLNNELIITRPVGYNNALRVSRTLNPDPTLGWTAETVWDDPNWQSIVYNPLTMLFGGFLQVSYNDDPVYSGRDQFFARWAGPPPFVPWPVMYLSALGSPILTGLGYGGGSVGLPITLPNASLYCNKTAKWKPRCK